EPLRKAGPDRRCRKDRAIAAAPADDHVGAFVEELNVRVDPSHGDDTLGRVQGGEVERRPRVEPRDLVASLDAPTQRILADLRIEITDAKPGQPVLLRKLANDADEQIDPAVAAGIAGRADDHRHAEAS